MYTYELSFVNDRDQKRWIRWNSFCNDPKTTLQMARGTLERFHAKFGAITILTEDGGVFECHWFDKVLN